MSCVNPLGAEPRRGRGSSIKEAAGQETRTAERGAINCLGTIAIYQSQQN